MEFMTTNDAVKKWGISERRIRQLLQDGRIEGAVKVGNNWNIPINANKPADKRSVKLDNIEFKFDLPDNYFDKVDELNKEFEYQIVGSTEADPRKNKISDESPVGKALMGKKSGQEAIVEVPSGEIKFKIISISK